MKKQQKKSAKSQSAHVYDNLIRRGLSTTGGVNLRENTLPVHDDGEHTAELSYFVADKPEKFQRVPGFPAAQRLAGHFETHRASAQETIVKSARNSMMRLQTRARTTYQPSRPRDENLED